MSPNLSLMTQAWRFVITGGLSAIVDYGIYFALHHFFGVQLDLAKAISFIAGTTTAYLINRRWTFQAPPSKARFVAVVALYAATFAVQVGINTSSSSSSTTSRGGCPSPSSSPRAPRPSSTSSSSARSSSGCECGGPSPSPSADRHR